MKLNKAACLLVGCCLLHVTLGQQISCPTLTCDSPESLEMDQCFQHDNSQPVSTIRTFGCEGYLESTLEGTPLCEFNLAEGKHAWYSEST